MLVSGGYPGDYEKGKVITGNEMTGRGLLPRGDKRGRWHPENGRRQGNGRDSPGRNIAGGFENAIPKPERYISKGNISEEISVLIYNHVASPRQKKSHHRVFPLLSDRCGCLGALSVESLCLSYSGK